MKWLDANWLFRPREFEAPVYERLGVRRFKKYMLLCVGSPRAGRLGWHPIRDRGGSVQDALTSFQKQTKRNESAHWVVLIGLAGMGVHLLVEGQYAQALAVILINIPFNVYPIMLQRYSRHRVNRLLASRKQTRGPSGMRPRRNTG